MQVLVMYYSRTGNTKKLAEAVADGVRGVEEIECIVKTPDDVVSEDFLNSHAIIAGSPVYFGSMAAELKLVFDKFVKVRPKMENKIGAAFATSAGASGGKETTIISILQAMLINGMIIVGDPLDAGGHYGVSCVDSPDAVTIENAKKMGRRVAELTLKLG